MNSDGETHEREYVAVGGNESESGMSSVEEKENGAFGRCNIDSDDDTITADENDSEDGAFGGDEDSESTDESLPDYGDEPPQRMPWYLVEADKGIAKGGEVAGELTYYVLHAMELRQADPSECYITRMVQFRIDGSREIEGRLLCVSDNHSVLNETASMLKKQHEMGKDSIGVCKALVQYSPTPLQVVHELIPKDELRTLNGEKITTIQPVVKTLSGERAHVLATHYLDGYLEKLLTDVRDKCYDLTFDDRGGYTPNIIDLTWLMVQYCPQPEMVVYAVVNHADTIWKDTNAYQDVVTYLRHDKFVVQAAVISYSTDRKILEEKLYTLQRNCEGANIEQVKWL